VAFMTFPFQEMLGPSPNKQTPESDFEFRGGAGRQDGRQTPPRLKRTRQSGPSCLLLM
jgi:hypothetical protein